MIRRLQVRLPNGWVVPLLPFGSLHVGLDQPIVRRRDRMPTCDAPGQGLAS